MMIDEIPIEISESSDKIIESIEEEEAVIEVKKGRGRPKGVVNKKEKPVPKAKVKKVKVKQIIESESEEEYVPQQQQYSTHDIASEVISMLSNRHLDRRLQKRDKYRSWFQ
jgi:hypothetical protein